MLISMPRLSFLLWNGFVCVAPMSSYVCLNTCTGHILTIFHRISWKLPKHKNIQFNYIAPNLQYPSNAKPEQKGYSKSKRFWYQIIKTLNWTRPSHTSSKSFCQPFSWPSGQSIPSPPEGHQKGLFCQECLMAKQQIIFRSQQSITYLPEGYIHLTLYAGVQQKRLPALLELHRKRDSFWRGPWMDCGAVIVWYRYDTLWGTHDRTSKAVPTLAPWNCRTWARQCQGYRKPTRA